MNQIFKEQPPIWYLHTIIDLFTIKENDEYVIDYITFKKMVFHKYQEPWLDELKEYYHNSKKFYITREFNYNSFITIIRQLCKIHGKSYRYTYDRNQNYQHLKYFIKL
jgi:hypothetical protein